MTNYSELINKALEMLKEDGELFCSLVDELDSWGGKADCFRCWPMWELDDFYSGVPASKLINDMRGNEFDLSDEWFYFDEYGLNSTNDREELYRDNIDEGEVLDEVRENRAHIYIDNGEFSELLDEIEEAQELETA